jgi:hypothetical protein
MKRSAGNEKDMEITRIIVCKSKIVLLYLKQVISFLDNGLPPVKDEIRAIID